MTYSRRLHPWNRYTINGFRTHLTNPSHNGKKWQPHTKTTHKNHIQTIKNGMRWMKKKLNNCNNIDGWLTTTTTSLDRPPLFCVSVCSFAHSYICFVRIYSIQLKFSAHPKIKSSITINKRDHQIPNVNKSLAPHWFDKNKKIFEILHPTRRKLHKLFFFS